MKDYGPKGEYFSFGMKWFLAIFAFLVVISAILGIGAFFGGWFSAGIEIVSPQNVQEQWRFAYEFEEKLKAAAQQVCLTEKTLAAAESATERTQRRSQLLAYEQNYTRIQADYDARLRNAFEAKLVAPSDVPREAPGLTAQKAKVCPA